MVFHLDPHTDSDPGQWALLVKIYEHSLLRRRMEHPQREFCNGAKMNTKHTRLLIPEYRGALTPEYKGALTPEYKGALTPEYKGALIQRVLHYIPFPQVVQVNIFAIEPSIYFLRIPKEYII